MREAVFRVETLLGPDWKYTILSHNLRCGLANIWRDPVRTTRTQKNICKYLHKSYANSFWWRRELKRFTYIWCTALPKWWRRQRLPLALLTWWRRRCATICLLFSSINWFRCALTRFVDHLKYTEKGIFCWFMAFRGWSVEWLEKTEIKICIQTTKRQSNRSKIVRQWQTIGLLNYYNTNAYSRHADLSYCSTF